MSMTSCSDTPSLVAIVVDVLGREIAFLERRDLLLALRRLKNSFFWRAVVPIFTRDQERRMYSWIEARIHHMA